MKKRLDQLLREYQEYLMDKCIYPENTSEWYAMSYTKPAIEKLLGPWFDKNASDNPFIEFNESKNNSIQRTFIISISECIIDEEIRNTSLGKSTKTIRNWRSGLRKFFDFLESENYYFATGVKTEILEEKLRIFGGSIEYDKKALQDIFWSRLITQDRAYTSMIYPARILNSIFNASPLKDDYKYILESKINDVKFLIDSGKASIALEDITSIKILFGKDKGGNVTISANGKQYELYTETPRNTYEKLQAKGMSDLSLDHDIPLQNIIDSKKAQKEYPVIKKLGDIYAQFVNGGTLVTDYLSVKEIRDFKGYSPKVYKLNKKFYDDEFIKELYDDMEKLYKNIDFTIMLKSYNSSKGKGKS